MKTNNYSPPKNSLCKLTLILAAIVLCFCGCYSTQNKDTSDYNHPLPDYAETDNINRKQNTKDNAVHQIISSYPPGFTADRTWTLKEIPDVKGIYKMAEYKDETWVCQISYPIMYTNPRYATDSRDFLHVNVSMDPFEIPHIKMGQDKMILKGMTGAICTPVLEMGYTIPYELSVYNGTIHSISSIGYAFGSKTTEFEEINGEAPHNFLNRLSSRFNIIKAEYGESFSFGYFSGTDFIEDTHIADAFYYIVADDSDYISLPVTKTRDGYFIVDYTSLEPGYYCFYISDNHTLIRVE